MARLYFYSVTLCIIAISLVASSSVAPTHQRICADRPFLHKRQIVCQTNHFQCLNNKCITRSYYCDKGNDCGDNSDEAYCNVPLQCPDFFSKCPSGRCIPNEWICDGISDCPSGEDESKCDNHGNDLLNGNNSCFKATAKSLRFLYNQGKRESTTEKWGALVHKTAVALYLSDRSFVTENETRKEVAYEISIQFLSRLYRTKLQDISSTELASFLNAFLVSCIDPRKFHGIDIVRELRNRVNKQNYTNPYVLLSLCNAGEVITESDKFKLIDTFYNRRRTFWTDMQAVAVMALSCASKQTGNGVDMDTLRELTMELKQHQYRNGTVENIQTTALVMQALLSVEPEPDPDNFDERKAFQQIILGQQPDGSFGNLKNTYFVLPALNCKSLVNISTDHCKTVRKDEISALEDLAKRSGPKIRVQYSLWIGNEKDFERNLALRVPANLSLYGVFEIAAEIDSRFQYEYVVKDRKPYINTISNIQDDPEIGKFWFLYTVKDGQPLPAKESPADVMPKDEDHFVMWYRSGSWTE